MKMITDLNELKAIELSVLKKVHQYCEENDIWYVLAYGTLLGTIRHNGFIPWDDDIDILLDVRILLNLKKSFLLGVKNTDCFWQARIHKRVIFRGIY